MSSLWTARQVFYSSICFVITFFFPGEAVAEAVYATLLQYAMEDKVLGCLADTTASNFGQWSGAMTILQVFK